MGGITSFGRSSVFLGRYDLGEVFSGLLRIALGCEDWLVTCEKNIQKHKLRVNFFINIYIYIYTCMSKLQSYAKHQEREKNLGPESNFWLAKPWSAYLETVGEGRTAQNPRWNAQIIAKRVQCRLKKEETQIL